MISAKYDGKVVLNPDGAPCSVTNISSKLFPETAQELRKFYLPSIVSPFMTNEPGQGTPSHTIFSIKNAADEEKDSAAVQGLAKLNLFGLFKT